MANEDVTISYGADISALKKQLGELKAASDAAGASVKTGLGAAFFGAAAGVGATATMAAINGLGYAVQGSITLMRDSVVAALESEQANRRLAESVKRAGESFSFTYDQLKESSRALQGQSIFSNEQIEAAQKVMIQYRLTGEQFRETQKLALDMAADLGKAPADAAKILARALADPEKAMRVLRASGVSLTEGARNQISTLIELGDVYGAQKALLEDLTKTFQGASAAAADTVTGGWQQISNTFKDLQGNLGEAILPLLKEMMPVLKEIVGVFADWARETTELIKSFGGMESVKDTLLALRFAIKGGALQAAGEDIGNAAGTVWNANKMGFRLGTEGIGALWDPYFWGMQDSTSPVRRRPRRGTADGLPNGTGPGGGGTVGTGDPMDYIDDGKKIGGISIRNTGIGAGVGLGLSLALGQSGMLDSLKSGSDDQIARLAAGIKKSVKDSGSDVEFKSGFEDSVGTFKRIQSAQYNVNKVEERQLSALEKLVLQENDKRVRDEQRNTTLIGIETALKNGIPSVLN